MKVRPPNAEVVDSIFYMAVATIFSAVISVASCYNMHRIATTLENQPAQNRENIQVRNIFGNEEPERFYEIDGKRFYLEVDGRPVRSYFESEK